MIARRMRNELPWERQSDNALPRRWYGRQGNGDAAAAIDELLAQLEAWALA